MNQEELAMYLSKLDTDKQYGYSESANKIICVDRATSKVDVLTPESALMVLRQKTIDMLETVGKAILIISPNIASSSNGNVQTKSS